MRKVVNIVIIVTLLLALTGCGSRVLSKKEDSSNGNSMKIVNPIQTVTKEELVERTGIEVDAPEGAGDVSYTIISTGETDPIAQVKFSWHDNNVTMRAKTVSGGEMEDISGLYYDWEESLDASVGEHMATIYLQGEVGYFAWMDVALGIQYNLSMTTGANAEELLTLAEMIFESK